MIYKPKRRRYYVIKFKWAGRLVHRRTRARDAKTARSIEAKIRTELAQGNWGILEAKPAPTLSDSSARTFCPSPKAGSRRNPRL